MVGLDTDHTTSRGHWAEPWLHSTDSIDLDITVETMNDDMLEMDTGNIPPYDIGITVTTDESLNITAQTEIIKQESASATTTDYEFSLVAMSY